MNQNGGWSALIPGSQAILQPTGRDLVEKLGKCSLYWLGTTKCLCASLPTSSGEGMCFTGLELVKEGSQSAFFILQFPKEAYKYLGIRANSLVYTRHLSGIQLASVQFQQELFIKLSSIETETIQHRLLWSPIFFQTGDIFRYSFVLWWYLYNIMSLLPSVLLWVRSTSNNANGNKRVIFFPV